MGSGYCCTKAPCPIALYRDWWNEKTGCRALRKRGDQFRCRAVELSPKVRVGLSVGAGCCSPMNSARQYMIQNQRGSWSRLMIERIKSWLKIRAERKWVVEQAEQAARQNIYRRLTQDQKRELRETGGIGGI